MEKEKKCYCFECKCLKFVPTTKPRMNPDTVHQSVWKKDLKEYNKLRKRCFYIKAKVDSSPPRIDIRHSFNKPTLKLGGRLAMRRDEENRKLIKAITTIERLGGRVDCVNTFANMSKSNWIIYRSNQKIIEKENKAIYKIIKKAVSLYAYSREDWEKWKTNVKLSSVYPFTILKKVNLDLEIKKQPSISSGLIKSREHGVCFLDFKVVGGESLGRIEIELYHEFTPVTVENFISLIRDYRGLNYKKCPIHRIVKNEYFECGDIIKGTGTGGFSVYGESFDEENHKLRHTKTGTLSMVRTNDQKNDSKFCITFQPLERLDRKNVVFGKVIKGINVLMKINGYGRYIGKPLVKIIITDCGQLYCPCNTLSY